MVLGVRSYYSIGILSRILYASRCCIFFNNAMELAYRGSIDDNVNRAGEVKERYLEMAMTRMAEGKKIKTPETKAIGCSIKREKKQ